MIASFPMYETVRMRDANDRFWKAIRGAYAMGPPQLTRGCDPHETWQRPDLLLSQTCGLPYRSTLHGKVHLVGTPDFDLPHCPPGYYRSHLVVRADDTRDTLHAFDGAILARNDVRSQSGWAAVQEHLQSAGAGVSFGRALDTGSHYASLLAVADGRADIAAIDAVTWALLDRDTHATQHLRILDSTTPTPGLPYITAVHENADALLSAMQQALTALSEEDRTCLMIRRILRIEADAYLALPIPAGTPLK